MRKIHPDYPRPQFVRENFQNWNGTWEFAFDDENRGLREGWWNTRPFPLTIQVPFSYETVRSGIHDTGIHPVVWYGRTMNFNTAAGGRVWLWFEGCDHKTTLWVNGQCMGGHTGGSTRFGFDITDALTNNSAEIVVRAEDPLTPETSRGKQRWLTKNFGCWYVQTTGIWKTVWSESVSAAALEHAKITPDLDNRQVEIISRIQGFGEGLELETVISFQGTTVCRSRAALTESRYASTYSLHQADLEWGVAEWSPETPNLYDVEFRLYRSGEQIDQVYSYFGLRKVSISGGEIQLNNRPLYQRLVLDQGYWPESGITPPDADSLHRDVELIRAMGFNGARKHQKIEDERFLYWCDVEGLLVWSEMAAAYRFTDESAAVFTAEWQEALRQSYNHPSIITWVPFNESWGVPNIAFRREEQCYTEAIYYLTKAYDVMRPVICNDGWEHTISDVITLHDYERDGESLLRRYGDDLSAVLENHLSHAAGRYAFSGSYSYKGQPILLSEYGGVALAGGEGWGYNDAAASVEEFCARLGSLTASIREIPGVCGYCVTQLTDVQQEINGLLDGSREPKTDLERFRSIFGK